MSALFILLSPFSARSRARWFRQSRVWRADKGRICFAHRAHRANLLCAAPARRKFEKHLGCRITDEAGEEERRRARYMYIDIVTGEIAREFLRKIHRSSCYVNRGRRFRWIVDGLPAVYLKKWRRNNVAPENAPRSCRLRNDIKFA